MGESQIYPEFFKVFIPQISSQRLLIPTAFLACIDKVVPNKAILRNRHGRLWQVEVVETDKGVYFRNGWANFVKDNSLELGEFLVFRYNGDYIFYVKCFGRSGCEKKDTMTSASIAKKISFINIKEEEGKHSEKQKEKVREEEDDDGDNGDDDNIYKEENFDDDDDEEEDDDDDNGGNDEEEKDYDDDEEEEEDDDDDNGDNDEEERDYDDDEEEEEEEEAKAYGRAHRKIGGCEDVNTKGENEGSPTVMVENCNGVDVGRYVQPKNAYFVTRLLSRKRGKVYVPTNVLEDFNIQLGQEMFLCDQYERKWRGKVVVWKDGRSWIGGWNTFCKWNKVTKQDICICEFIGGNLIQVHIVRA